MQFDVSKLDNIPKNSYLVVKKDVDNEDHIIEKKPTTGARIYADNLVKSCVSYVPKGLSGSKNSNFYEFLSMGAIPNLVGSAMLILISNALNNKYGGKDSIFAGMNGKKMAGGVVLYAAGKWLGKKIIDKGVDMKTGLNIGMDYKKNVHELPEYKGDNDNLAVEFHKVYESVDFPRHDLIKKQGEENNQRYEYYDKAAEKMGYEKQLNSPDQTTIPKIKEVQVKSTAAKAISPYLWAALGVAIASQDAFGNIFAKSSTDNSSFLKRIKSTAINAGKTMKDSVKSLAKTKIGKFLIGAAVLSSAFGIVNSTSGFKKEKENKDSSVDYNSKYMEF